MRKTKDQLLIESPLRIHAKHDIVAEEYGDIPSYCWNEEKYEIYKGCTGTIANIQAVDAYIYSVYGKYYVYNTQIGRVYMTKNGDVLCGDINIKYSGMTYNIILNLMYGWKKLDILRISHTGVVGFSNEQGQGSPSTRTKEMDPELIDRIINNPLNDFGYGIQEFMKVVRNTYYEDPKNHIMNKLFRM